MGERICKWSALPTDGQVVVGASAAPVAAHCKYEAILADLDRSVIALVRGLAGVSDELGTVCAAELEAWRIGRGDKRCELTGQGVDNAERVNSIDPNADSIMVRLSDRKVSRCCLKSPNT